MTETNLPRLLLDAITQSYLASSAFNGISLADIKDLFKHSEVKRPLSDLIRQGLIAPVFGDRHPNRHVRALPEHHSIDRQIEILNEPTASPCLYPLPKHLEQAVDRATYVGRPYSLALALGEPRLTHHFFELVALETYRNDPRYSYDVDDMSGTLSIHDNVAIDQAHQVYIQQFGFAYDDQWNKYVAVTAWDLHRLSSEHQQKWKMHETDISAHLNPDYFRATILGEWPEYISMYQGFLEELQLINKMSTAMGRPVLFREDYKNKSRPRGLYSLLRPTSREYNDFVQLLDKLMSDNINKPFFQTDVADHDMIPLADGSFERRVHGTIQMLDDWTNRYFRPSDPAPILAMLATFRKVRRERQAPAHAEQENLFDNAYLQKQQELMTAAYGAVRTLRLILANHPAAQGIEVSEWLKEGKIWPA